VVMRHRRRSLAPAHIAVGVDTARPSEVADSVEQFGARYLDRIYTRHEQDSCFGSHEVRARGLAGRFAAKEAVIKVLRPLDEIPEWTSIEIVRHPQGWCDVGLSGTARRLADEAGIVHLAVSLTHEGDSAIAVIVGIRSRSAAGNGS
jgi:holo-[acyl-carrier protein] synthase